ncbi:hypothetical protein ykris0001_45050 [Yersinia kristensenii ATCC 33638]|nr:hypothetical protein ykris0001_45050 [Yersinia kristensenii ATCC 33638]
MIIVAGYLLLMLTEITCYSQNKHNRQSELLSIKNAPESALDPK